MIKNRNQITKPGHGPAGFGREQEISTKESPFLSDMQSEGKGIILIIIGALLLTVWSFGTKTGLSVRTLASPFFLGGIILVIVGVVFYTSMRNRIVR